MKENEYIRIIVDKDTDKIMENPRFDLQIADKYIGESIDELGKYNWILCSIDEFKYFGKMVKRFWLRKEMKW